MFIALIDYDDLTEDQKTKVICLYKVTNEKIEDFTVAIDEIHDEGGFHE